MQGFNMGRYVPPEFEGQVSGNQLHGKKAPGLHASKQTVRFEMPFNIWCSTCEGHIAQGVRFNAEKKKVGNYFSTPIFAFRMRHTVCSGWIEVRTDPQNTAYVVAEGAKKKAADDEPVSRIIKIHDPADLVDDDPFAKTEKNVRDKTEIKQGAARITELRELSDRQWSDPWEHSRKMRKVFRAERKVLEEKATAAEAIKDRAGLAIELLDEAPEDAVRAKLVTFGPDHERRVFEAHSKPLFEKNMGPKTTDTTKTKGKLKSQQASDRTRGALQKDLMRNTRAAIDPFLAHNDRPRPDLGIKINKRKAPAVSTESGDVETGVPEADQKRLPISLELDYSSD